MRKGKDAGQPMTAAPEKKTRSRKKPPTPTKSGRQPSAKIAQSNSPKGWPTPQSKPVEKPSKPLDGQPRTKITKPKNPVIKDDRPFKMDTAKPKSAFTKPIPSLLDPEPVTAASITGRLAPTLDLPFVEQPKPAPAPWVPSGLKPKGTLTVNLFGVFPVTLTGGPYHARPNGMRGIKMAKEIQAHCDIDIPTPDFQCPPKASVEAAALTVAMTAIETGDQWYVGCMAGQGRTGLFLAGLAYLAGEDDPVRFVRANYYPHAVETVEQEKFVTSLDRDTFRRRLMAFLILGKMVRLRDVWRMNWTDKKLWFKLRFPAFS